MTKNVLFELDGLLVIAAIVVGYGGGGCLCSLDGRWPALYCSATFLMGKTFFGTTMSKIETIEQEIKMLSSEELAAFRNWFRQFDAEAWDRQIEDDANSGKLDALANAALKSFQSGGCTEL